MTPSRPHYPPVAINVVQTACVEAGVRGHYLQRAPSRSPDGRALGKSRNVWRAAAEPQHARWRVWWRCIGKPARLLRLLTLTGGSGRDHAASWLKEAGVATKARAVIGGVPAYSCRGRSCLPREGPGMGSPQRGRLRLLGRQVSIRASCGRGVRSARAGVLGLHQDPVCGQLQGAAVRGGDRVSRQVQTQRLPAPGDVVLLASSWDAHQLYAHMSVPC